VHGTCRREHALAGGASPRIGIITGSDLTGEQNEAYSGQRAQ
jgi:hypothetical protein